MRAARRLGASIAGTMLVACSAVLGLTDPRVVDPDEGGAPDAPFDVEASAPPAPPDANDASDAGSFCSRLDATPTLCDDFDEQPTLSSWWKPQANSGDDASIAVVPATFASSPSALAVDFVSRDGVFPVDAFDWIRFIHPGPVTKSVTFAATVVVDDIAAAAGADAGTTTPDARLMTMGDALYSVEINLTSSAPPGTLGLDLAESFPDAGYNAHNYTFAIDFTRGEKHRLVVRIDVAATSIAVELDGFVGTRDDPSRAFQIPSAGLSDVHLDLGTKTDRPNTHAAMRLDDVVLDLE